MGVTKIHEIKSLKTKNKALNLIGISCDVNEEKKLLSDGILVNYLHYKVCKYNKPTRLIQCYNCQGFGHYAKTCKEFISRCVVCSEHHEDPKKKCEAITKKCANCGENHTANYSGCNAIKKKLIEIREKESERMLKTKTVYQPSYASKVSNDNQQIILKTINNIEKKLSNIENSIEKKLEENTNALEKTITSNVENIINQLNAFKNEMKDIKVKIAYSFIDFNYINHPANKPDETKIQQLIILINNIIGESINPQLIKKYIDDTYKTKKNNRQ